MTEADLVSAYLAKGGKVTKCPTGKSGMNIEYVWQDGAGLVSKDPEASKRAFRRSLSGHFQRKRVEPNAEVVKRRETVAAQMDAGMTGVQIAAMLGVNVYTVYDDANAMGKKFPRATPPGFDTLPHVALRRAKVEKLAKEGLTGGEIARKVRAPEGTVRHDLRVLGVKLDRASATRKAWREGKREATKRNETSFAPSESVAERRAKVPGMIAQGMGTTDIARALGVATGVIRHDCRHLGIPSPGKAQQMKDAA